jgi:hypothetical protein
MSRKAPVGKKQPAGALKSRSVVVEKAGRRTGGAELYVMHTPDGRPLKLKVTASSTASMDKTVERFAEAMKRLAKR